MIRTDRNQTFDRSGNLIHEEVIDVDVTADTNRGTIEDRLRTALAGNATYLAIATPTAAQTTAQAKALTRQVSALIRHQLAGDLLADTTGT